MEEASQAVPTSSAPAYPTCSGSTGTGRSASTSRQLSVLQMPAGSGESSLPFSSGAVSGTFSVRVFKADFKFNAAHFIAYSGFRERLHGHNYRVGVEMWTGSGRAQLEADGYVMDFGQIKRTLRAECKALNERFLCPCASDVLRISFPAGNTQLQIDCEDGSMFSFPRADCAELPIVHSSVEELAVFFSDRLISAMREELVQRGIDRVEVTVAEAPGQSASYSVTR